MKIDIRTIRYDEEAFRQAGVDLFNRPSDEEYVRQWTEQLAQPKADGGDKGQLLLIFRIGKEYLALPTALLHHVGDVLPAHRIPHRPLPIRGLVNINGLLAPCVCLANLLNISADAEAGESARLLMAGTEPDLWAFTVDEVITMYRLAQDDIQSLPVTVGRSPTQRTRVLFDFDNRQVGLLDENLLASAIERSLR